MIRLPEAIEAKMKLFRAGMDRLPQEYIDYHEDLARMDSKSHPDFVVVDNGGMVYDGWMDGMRVLQHLVRDRKTGKEFLIQWSDSNGKGAWFRLGRHGNVRQYEMNPATVRYLETLEGNK